MLWPRLTNRVPSCVFLTLRFQPHTCSRANVVFGPVCIIEPFTDFKAVIDTVNDSKFGLQAGVFTNDLQKVRVDGRGHTEAAQLTFTVATLARFWVAIWPVLLRL